MARRKSTRRSKKPDKAVRRMSFILPAGGASHYIDLAEALSIVNRKLFRQGYVYGVESIEYGLVADPTAIDTISVRAQTAGDSWCVHNAHVKGHALWNEMNQLVLADNPSVQGKWADFKVFLDAGHRASYFGTGNLQPVDGSGVAYLPGEWNYSDYVLPQHEVDPISGLPLPADQTQAHLIGADVGVPGAFQSVGLVQAYSQSRATVSDQQPNVPVGMSDSFFSLLTDTGSQEPELGDVIEGENDSPPYDLLNYPGGQANGDEPHFAETGVATLGSPVGLLTPFAAQCGLIKITSNAYHQGVPAAMPGMTVHVTLMAGDYRGIAAIPMGQ